MAPLDPAAVRLLDEDVEVRREAAEAVDAQALTGRFALRQALLTDADAQVRAIAARRLGEARDRRFIPALLESLRDTMPSVRDRAWRALARLGARELLIPAARALREEAVWWVRRAAVRAAASVAGAGALELLLETLEDPFWRVRHAAVQALAWLGAEEGEVRERVLAAAERAGLGPVRAAALYLGSVWGMSGAGTSAMESSPAGAARPEAAVQPNESPPASGVRLGAEVHARESLSVGAARPGEEDPAVTTAHLEQRPAQEVSARELVEWLGDPHEPLRLLARRRLLQRRDPEAIRLALRWLDAPRVPHAAAEARALLSRLDLDEVALATRILHDAPRPGALEWAVQVAAGRAQADLLARARELARHPEAAVRRAVLSGLAGDPESRPVVLAALDDAEDTVRERVLAAWERRPTAREAQEAFARALIAFAPRAASPRERRAVVSAAGFVDEEDLLARLSGDEDTSVRAMALAARMTLGELSEAERREAASHEDPWVRAAVLEEESALEAAREDADVTVRRMALDLLVTHRRMLTPEELREAALTGARAQDPWMRARAAEALHPEASREELVALLRLSMDTAAMVRASAASALESSDSLEGHLLLLLLGPEREEDGEVRASAYTWLLRGADGRAFERLCTALRDPTEPARVVTHLEAMSLVFPEEPFESAPDIARRRPKRELRLQAPIERMPEEHVPHTSWRPLGKTGLTVSPLVLSGANALAAHCFEEAREAGVNTFFWEPRYLQLTRFLRATRATRHRLVVVGGTYHSGPTALRRDVEAALRRLRTDWLDVFLLFWVRAPERLNAEDFAALEALRAEGKVRTFGFSTHHRDLAVDALQRHPWPVVMTRHSAAHPGAEARLFPEAQTRGTGLLTFTSTCYGRLLRPTPDAPPDAPVPTAVDCYRYSLSQPGVSACLSAPRGRREMMENLQVLARPWMMADALEGMRAHGGRVRAGNQRFNALVRQAPGGARDTLLALLEEEGPGPGDGTLPSV
ncbi:aldo/keto reductase [Myxococcaceae bacterium GXIMD 01537]